MMKSRSRREIIEENKRLKREAEEQRKRTFETVDRYARAASAAHEETEKFVRALVTLGENPEIRYKKPSDGNTFVDYVTIHPMDVETSAEGYGMEVAREHLARRLAEALIEKGLIRAVKEGIDPASGMYTITARLDVIPWWLISEKDPRARFMPPELREMPPVAFAKR